MRLNFSLCDWRLSHHVFMSHGWLVHHAWILRPWNAHGDGVHTHLLRLHRWSSRSRVLRHRWATLTHMSSRTHGPSLHPLHPSHRRPHSTHTHRRHTMWRHPRRHHRERHSWLHHLREPTTTAHTPTHHLRHVRGHEAVWRHSHRHHGEGHALLAHWHHAFLLLFHVLCPF